MARGEDERKAFESIKHQLFVEKALRCSYEEYCKDRIILSKRPMENFYAMTEQDIERVEDIFFKATPNDDLSKFPDFISDDGFVEHFQITSSEITKAGAGYKKDFSLYEKTFEKEVEQLQAEMNEKPSFDRIRGVEKAFSYREKHSHENLLMSLRQSLDKHIKSEENYAGNKTTKIFMIEYNELSLKVQIDYPHIKAERVYGDLLRREEETDYRFSRDKEVLRLLYERRDYIDYIIYVTDFLFEIIKVEDIPEILKLLVYDYEFHPVMVTTMSSMYGISIPGNLMESEEKSMTCLH